MGIDCPEGEDIPAAVTRSGDVGTDGVGTHGVDSGDIDSEGARRPLIDAVVIGLDKEWEADVPDERTAAAPEFAEQARRNEYYAEFRAKVEAVYLADARQQWEEAKPGFAEEWHRYADEHPTQPSAPPDISEEVYVHIERGCKEISETEENIVTPAMARVEAEDPERTLVGMEFRCKGQDRIGEKVAYWMAAQSELTPAEALAMVKDPIRYTFQYSEERYTEGVNTDVERLKTAGFDLIELRNSWGSDTYKGINSRWSVPEKEQLFEVQFHTEISFEAKQLTHPAYERFRNTSTPEAEQDELVGSGRLSPVSSSSSASDRVAVWFLAVGQPCGGLPDEGAVGVL